MSNPFVHVELVSTDVGKAKSFQGLFARKLEDTAPAADRDEIHDIGD